MSDRSSDLKKWWYLLPLLLAPLLGLRAQCDGPFNLACITDVNLTLNDTCGGIVTYDMVVTGLPVCLGKDNFTVSVVDGNPANGALVDGPGRFRYSVAGKNHPDLADFSCWGYVNVTDLTPPQIAPLDPNPLILSCAERMLLDVNELPAGVSHCYRIDGTTGEVIPGTLDPALRTILTRGTDLPLITDACGGEVEVCVSDLTNDPPGSECFDTIRMVRTFTATQLPPNLDLAPAVSAQNIFFVRPNLDDLRGVEEARFISCEDFLNGAPNPLPRETDYPFFTTSAGPANLREGFCQYGVIVTDSERIAGCGDNFLFFRTFKLLDWCTDLDTTFVQVVRVGDLEGPVITPPTQDNDFDGVADTGPLRFPSNTDDCAGYVNVRTGGVAVTDACDDDTELVAYVYPNQDLTGAPLGPYPVFSDDIMDALTAPIPVGTHLLRYVANDGCNNRSTLDVIFEVFDAVEPTMVCEDGLNVVLDGSGLAVLRAEHFDAGSTDDCSTITFQVALADNAGNLLTTLDDQVVFTCENLGVASIILQGTDAAGNVNRCWLNILVEDKTYPICIPPADVSLTCTAFSSEFSADLAWDFAADPFGVGAQLDAFFGAETSQDNCPGMRSLQSINGQLNNCGVGQFIRFFRVVDASGQLANNECRQVINVTPHHEYSIRFPGDERYLCGELPDPEDIVGEESGCDLLSVTTDVDTLTVTDVGDCYKLRLTHEVINWCEYDDISPAIQVPRDPDNDGNFEEPVFLNIAGISTATLDDDRAILDQDATPFNGNDLRTLLPNFGTDRRRGHYRYRQFVRVYDDIDPTLTVPLPDLGLAFTEDCRGGVILEFTATDNCSGATTTRIFLDQDAVDRNNDGNLTGVDFVSDREIAPSRFVGDPATGVEVFIRNLPIGQHLARVITFDGCGNQDQRYVVLTVEDSKAPTPACIQSLSTALMPDPDFGGIGVVWANDYVASPAVVCTETEITYAIYRETEAREAGFIPDPTHDRLDVDCSDVGELPVRIYAFAASNGRYDFCNATLHVSANNGDVCADRNANIAGLIRTETGLPMGDVTVYNDGPTSLQDVTTEDGTFLFDGLQELQDYTIQPYDNRDAINGVTTRDITIVARYLLGVDDKLSPYQLIAADANRNREITVRDLLMIREVILGIKDNFDNNTSWRFLPSSYTFPDPEDPFLEVFPEVGNFNDLSGNNFVEFVGLKVGDLDNSAGVFEGLPPEDGNGLAGPTTDLYLRPVAGQPQAWELFAGQEVAGMQFSLDLPAKTRVLPGQITTEEYRLVGNGRLHVSHVATSRSFGHALLRFEVPKEALPRLVQEDTDQRFLTAEAYDKTMATFGLRLRVTEAEAIVSASVFPNPVVETATLSLSWPVAEAITLTVQDLAGRVVVRRELSLLAGNNTVPLRATELRDGAGVYLLSLRGAQHDTALRVVRQ